MEHRSKRTGSLVPRSGRRPRSTPGPSPTPGAEDRAYWTQVLAAVWSVWVFGVDPLIAKIGSAPGTAVPPAHSVAIGKDGFVVHVLVVTS